MVDLMGREWQVKWLEADKARKAAEGAG